MEADEFSAHRTDSETHETESDLSIPKELVEWRAAVQWHAALDQAEKSLFEEKEKFMAEKAAFEEMKRELLLMREQGSEEELTVAAKNLKDERNALRVRRTELEAMAKAVAHMAAAESKLLDSHAALESRRAEVEAKARSVAEFEEQLRRTAASIDESRHTENTEHATQCDDDEQNDEQNDEGSPAAKEPRAVVNPLNLAGSFPMMDDDSSVQFMDAMELKVVPRDRWPEKSTIKQCMFFECGKSLRFFTKKDHCHSCGIVCCSDCLEHWIDIPPVYMEPKPVCPRCFAQVEGRKRILLSLLLTTPRQGSFGLQSSQSCPSGRKEFNVTPRRMDATAVPKQVVVVGEQEAKGTAEASTTSIQCISGSDVNIERTESKQRAESMYDEQKDALERLAESLHARELQIQKDADEVNKMREQNAARSKELAELQLELEKRCSVNAVPLSAVSRTIQVAPLRTATLPKVARGFLTPTRFDTNVWFIWSTARDGQGFLLEMMERTKNLEVRVTIFDKFSQVPLALRGAVLPSEQLKWNGEELTMGNVSLCGSGCCGFIDDVEISIGFEMDEGRRVRFAPWWLKGSPLPTLSSQSGKISKVPARIGWIDFPLGTNVSVCDYTATGTVNFFQWALISAADFENAPDLRLEVVRTGNSVIGTAAAFVCYEGKQCEMNDPIFSHRGAVSFPSAGVVTELGHVKFEATLKFADNTICIYAWAPRTSFAKIATEGLTKVFTTVIGTCVADIYPKNGTKKTFVCLKRTFLQIKCLRIGHGITSGN